MTKPSIAAQVTPAQAIITEANRVIATLNYSTPADRDMVESVLESLKAVADVIAPSVGKNLRNRILAIRNNIHVNSIQAA